MFNIYIFFQISYVNLAKTKHQIKALVHAELILHRGEMKTQDHLWFMSSDLTSSCELWDADVDKEGGWRDRCSVFRQQVYVTISWRRKQTWRGICVRQRVQSEPIVLLGFDVFSVSAFPHLVGRTWTEEWTVRWSRSWTPCRSPPPRSEPGPAQGRGWRNSKFRSTRGWNLRVEERGWLNWEVTFTYFQTSLF